MSHRGNPVARTLDILAGLGGSLHGEAFLQTLPVALEARGSPPGRLVQYGVHMCRTKPLVSTDLEVDSGS